MKWFISYKWISVRGENWASVITTISPAQFIYQWQRGRYAAMSVSIVFACKLADHELIVPNGKTEHVDAAEYVEHGP